MSEQEDEKKIHRGLIGVEFDRTSTTRIDGKKGELRYRGYSIHDLATHSSFEETAYLLMYGALPTTSELQAFDEKLKAARRLPPQILELLQLMKDAHPMEALRTAVSALGGFDADCNNADPAVVLDKGIQLSSQVPMIVTAHHNIRQGRDVIAADPDLGHAGNFLYMLKGEVPSPEAAKLMDTDFVLHAEHGSNASSFTARVVTGTDANIYASMTAAVAALSGPAHGGAAEDVMRMAREISDPANAAAYVKDKRKQRQAITGFGHRVYKAEDPRARHMRDGVAKLSEQMGEPKWFNILQAVVDAMAPYARHGIHVNVDFYSGVAYHLHGITEDLFVPIFAIGRVPGWTVQVLEQLDNNILIRPLLRYEGPESLDYIPLDQR
jgi:citrate synthase